MKRIVVLLTIAFMIFMLCACGNTELTINEGPKSGTEEIITKKEPTEIRMGDVISYEPLEITLEDFCYSNDSKAFYPKCFSDGKSHGSVSFYHSTQRSGSYSLFVVFQVKNNGKEKWEPYKYSNSKIKLELDYKDGYMFELGNVTMVRKNVDPKYSSVGIAPLDYDYLMWVSRDSIPDEVFANTSESLRMLITMDDGSQYFYRVR